MNEFKITSLQRLCLHDGPGVRTTVFLHGCLLDCPWCCNPETKYSSPIHFDGDETKSTFQIVDEDYLYDKIVADKEYYGEDGGVTFSGGEPLIWSSKLKPLFVRLKASGISIFVETSAYIPIKNIIEVHDLVDGYIVDFKRISKPHMYDNNSDIYLHENISFMKSKIAKTRMVLISGITDTVSNIEDLRNLIIRNSLPHPEFLQYHSLGQKKAERLGFIQPIFDQSNEGRVNEIIGLFEKSRYSKI